MKNSILFVGMFLWSVMTLAQSDAKAIEILQKNIEASGGKDKMMAIKSMTRTMEVNMPFGTAEAEAFYKNGKFYTKSSTQGNVVFEQKYDGNRAFVGGMQGNQVLDDEKAVKRIADQGKIFPMVDMETTTTLKYAGTDKVNGAECHKITTKSEDGNEGTMFFDAKSNMLVRMIQVGEFNGTKFESTIDFSDYKPIDNILFAHKMSMTNAQFSMEMKMKDIKLNPEIADKIFMIE